ncbi:hypothetical protein GC102_00355 [Paenibacillus sp. LMG 31460]|uniref:Type I restriction modification DNA specificity domain-containing protein n=1 Tax=Paenibacillus germinis TaxID=2654979 RepID=A0ABX1YT23_9BACL|nr:restriction endonuclease subunit S [Paenibacillus germinis]NOU84242.1 hypothetical protein [Paenibacillus germinis]
MSFEGWKEVKLGEVADVLSGFAFKSNDFVDEGIPVVKIKNIVPPIIDLTDVQYVTEELFIERNKYALNYNDILISMTGSNVNQIASAVGKIGRVKLSNVRLLLNQRVGKLFITDTDSCDHDFLYYYLIQDEVRYNLAASAGGSANQANISPNQIKNIDLMLPSLDEQKVIATLLSSLDDKIILNNRMNKVLELMAQAIFKQWFVDFEFPNENCEPYKSSSGEMEWCEEFGKQIPKGWKYGELDELCEITSSKRIFMSDYENHGVPFFRSKEIIEKFKGNLISTELFISENKFNEIKEKHGSPKQGDILLTSVGTLGVPYLVKEERFYFKDGNLTWFRNFNKPFFSKFIYYWLLFGDGKKQIDSITIGSTQKAITIQGLKKMKIIIPSNYILENYEKLISSIRLKYEVNIALNARLSSLRDTLLPKLMSGELDVSDIEL